MTTQVEQSPHQRLRVLDLYPSLLQPEGDGGNPLVLAHRARKYGVQTEITVVHPGDAIPHADIVCLGGSEDADLPVAAQRLHESGALNRLAATNAVVFAVGAGYALLANTFQDAAGQSHQGLGLLDVEMCDAGRLIAGPVVSAPRSDLGLPALSGYEYHRNVATTGPSEPWLRLTVGHGNGRPADRQPADGDRHDGTLHGRILGTWWHGPVLPRNPELADLLLRWAGVNVDPAGCPEDALARRVRAVRIAEAQQRSNM